MELIVMVLFGILGTNCDSFSIINPTIEVFKGQGLRVSIPEQEDVTQFAFYAKIDNKFEKLDDVEPEAISKNVSHPINGRWTFYDPNINLRIGNVIDWWADLGHRHIEGTHVVTRLLEHETTRSRVARAVGFEVPDALVEVFKPRGLRVSIPDQEGIKLFAFHAKVNEEMNGREGGTFSRDIIKAKDGRWTFWDPYAQLKQGDIIYYWTYVDYFDGRNKLGYTQDDQKFVVTELREKDAPSTIKPVEQVTLSSGCIASNTVSNGEPACNGDLIFSEDFNKLRKKFWNRELKFAGKPDYEFVIYTNQQENLDVQDGHLKVRPVPSTDLFGSDFVTYSHEFDLGANCTGVRGTTDCVQKSEAFLILPPVASAQITTKNKFSFKFGKIEIRAKMPKGDWIYPELFLNPVNEEYGPGYASGQIRVAFVPGNADSNRILSGGCILGHSQGGRSYGIKSMRKNLGSWCDDYHKFTVIWKPDHISLSVDDVVYGNIHPPQGGFAREAPNLGLGNVHSWHKGSPLAPFDKEMYLAIGVGVGGHCFEDRSDNSKPWRNLEAKAQKNFFRAMPQWYRTWSDASVLDVDYVKVWAL